MTARSDHDNAFEMATSGVRFGPGVTHETGAKLADAGIRRALVITDPFVRELTPVVTVIESLEREKIAYSVFDRVHVEPTDQSFAGAIQFARSTEYDGVVAVGGGSVIDTAKAANLYACYPPAEFLDYVNPPVGKGLPVPGPVKPLYAVPTT